MDKQHIIDEIQRTAKNGKALGKIAFTTVTGIKENAWSGKYWARWGDALAEAGYARNERKTAHGESFVFESLLQLTRKYGRFPTRAEMQLEKRLNPSLPSEKTVLDRFKRTDLINGLINYCAAQGGYDDVAAILKAIPAQKRTKEASEDGDSKTGGYVYLVSAQSSYKIGCTRAPYRRAAEIANQSANGAELLHLIPTDDPEGIERYWHQRFEDKRINGTNKQSGEWFNLSKDEVKAFKRRKNFM